MDALWSQLQEMHEKERKELEAEKMALEKEKATIESEKAMMENAKVERSDIIEINVGGEAIIQCRRQTLCLAPDTMFTYMFSGRWKDSIPRDDKGRVFFDHDPELIRLIINHLRIKQIENPEQPVGPPKIPKGKKRELICLLRYFGLFSFFFGDSGDFKVANLEFAHVNSTLLRTVKHDSTELKLQYNGGGHSFAALGPPLRSQVVSCWKIVIDNLPNNSAWLFLGIIGGVAGGVSETSYGQACSHGWATQSQVYCSGRSHRHMGGWSGFENGEELHFCCGNSKLSMYSVHKNKTFHMEVQGLKQAFIHFNFNNSGTRISVSALNEEEEHRMVTLMGEE